MSRDLTTLPAYPSPPTAVTITTFFKPLKDDLDLVMLGLIARNQYGGGSEHVGFGVGVGTGWLTAYDCVEFEIDNTSNQLSTSPNLVARVRCAVRVEDSSITVTPRIYNITGASVPTQSGAAACSATADDFSDTNQKQTLLLTIPSGKNKFVVQCQKSVDSFQAWLAKITWDIYING